jgi:hypothetical protein
VLRTEKPRQLLNLSLSPREHRRCGAGDLELIDIGDKRANFRNPDYPLRSDLVVHSTLELLRMLALRTKLLRQS